ncbi:MAG: hypothetical protein M3340_09360 [Actinomycetota bacterium]|nr:hypothetical protein [Actinomycetota bacterium]
MLSKLAALRWLFGILGSAVLILGVTVSVLVGESGPTEGEDAYPASPAAPGGYADPGGYAGPGDYGEPEDHVPAPTGEAPGRRPAQPVVGPCQGAGGATATIESGLTVPAGLQNTRAVAVGEDASRLYVSAEVDGVTATWLVVESYDVFAATQEAGAISEFPPASPDEPGSAAAIQASQECPR